jgi:hypothetical protein
MGTEPDAIAELLALQAKYSKLLIRRFVTEAGSTFYPKAWIFFTENRDAASLSLARQI